MHVELMNIFVNDLDRDRAFVNLEVAHEELVVSSFEVVGIEAPE